MFNAWFYKKGDESPRCVNGSGILLFNSKNNTVLLFKTKARQGNWADLGGRLEKIKDSTDIDMNLWETAKNEALEETSDYLKFDIENPKSFHDFNYNHRRTGPSFYRGYVVDIDNFDSTIYNENKEKFNTVKDDIYKSFKETADVKEISLEKFGKYFTKKNDTDEEVEYIEDNDGLFINVGETEFIHDYIEIRDRTKEVIQKIMDDTISDIQKVHVSDKDVKSTFKNITTICRNVTI